MLRFLGLSEQPQWERRAQEKLKSIHQAIPSEWLLSEAEIARARQMKDVTGDYITKFLTAREKDITMWDATIVAKNVQEGVSSAVEVTSAFCHRAAIAHQLVNCLHEVFFEAALDRARELDAFQMHHRKVMGPLHGVPVSLKDQFYVKNVDTTMGYVGWIGNFEGKENHAEYKTRESMVVKELLALGAVLYCKTSLPQTLLLGETHNNIIGVTTNPVNQALSCGGSSGGEGALLALGGSCVGVGTDIGGSVRIPAAFCGIHSIKPSHNRFSYRDMANSSAEVFWEQLDDGHKLTNMAQNPGQTLVKSAVGFMATSLLSLRFIQKALLTIEPWYADSEVVHLPWRSDHELLQTDLSFAILYDDGYCKLHPPVERGLKAVEMALEAVGHEVITWCPPFHREGCRIHGQFMLCDGGTNIWQQLNLSGEPLIDELKRAFGSRPRPPIPLLEFQDLALEREQYRQKYNDYWESSRSLTKTGRPVDALIMAVAPHAAVIPGKYFHYGYSEIVNLLDYTSVTIPVGKAEKDTDVADSSYEPRNAIDHQNWDAYDATIYDGAPIGVQIVARQLQEERCIGLAQKVEDALTRFKQSKQGEVHGAET